ncbi:MAG: class I SAM-dependent methyltransferase [Oscillospiraceae bacterium]|nr:class I SAM-dependent methyltransferase [Oscillospiraceae bacterium]
MRATKDWKDYELLDSSSGERLERWGNVTLIRPDPQVIWKTPKTHPAWKNADARYHRSQKGGGSWEVYKNFPEEWEISYKDLKFKIKPMGFKHTGLFPEQAVNWDFLREVIRAAKAEGREEIKVLNLFAYTGGATVAALSEDAHVVHVDASKGMVQYAKENVVLSGFSDRHVRYLVDDCVKFVQREIRRGNKYDIIIMDPPSYGRGPGGEIWKLEDTVYDFVELTSQVLSDAPLMVLINSYTTGLSPSVMNYILGSLIVPKFGGKVSCDEIGLMTTNTGLHLPCGASAIWQK